MILKGGDSNSKYDGNRCEYGDGSNGNCRSNGILMMVSVTVMETVAKVGMVMVVLIVVVVVI